MATMAMNNFPLNRQKCREEREKMRGIYPVVLNCDTGKKKDDILVLVEILTACEDCRATSEEQRLNQQQLNSSAVIV